MTESTTQSPKIPAILFVDDEPDILAGIRSNLRKRRKEWDMRFAAGGEAGLEEIATRAFDVVVSDMRMPGVDGATLLGRVRDEQPDACRIILSGQAGDAATMRGIAIAHQWLAKPCERGTLEHAIDAALQSKRLIEDLATEVSVGGVDALPTPPILLNRILEIVSDPDCDVDALAKVIEEDPAISAKLLQLTNSSFFSLACEVKHLSGAIVRLGLATVKALVVSESVVHSISSDPDFPIKELEEIQRHSLRCGRLAARLTTLVEEKEDDLSTSAFTAGLLHDVGRLMLLGRKKKGDLKISYPRVGAGLLATWGLPLPIVDATARHCGLSELDGEPHAASVCVHLAHALLSEIEAEKRGGESEVVLDPRFMEWFPEGTELEDLQKIAIEMDAKS